MKLGQRSPKDGSWRKTHHVKSKTEEENGRWYPLRVKLKRDTEEVIYNIKRDFEIQTQRIPPTKKNKESARNE